MPDNNFLSFAGHVGYKSDLIVDPTPEENWADPLKFSNVKIIKVPAIVWFPYFTVRWIMVKLGL